MIGKTISHYKILEKLGEGGMGVVYKAHDTKLDRDVALKFLPATLHPSPEELKRFEQEAKAISALNHANISTIYDVDEYEGQHYLVLEYIPGGTLKLKLKQLKSDDKEFSISEVVDYGIQMAKALAHAHQHGIVHRDVKTDNIMLMEDGTVKLTDFGLAKLRGNIKLTKTGSTVGTAAYMSPEQIRGEEVDNCSDIFSYGVVLYELVTSHLPFRGEFETAINYSILNEDPPSLRSLRKNAPAVLENIIQRCLEKDKTKRYQSADDIVAELKKIQRELSGSIEKVTKLSKVWWIAAIITIVVIADGIYLFYPRSTSISINKKSIAVLPFTNLSDSKDDEYFADGLTEDVITQVSKIQGFNKVIARTSVMRYKQTTKDVKDIGKELDVASILEGSVRRVGNKVRVVAQLIDASTGGHVWADTYDKDMQDIFSIQSDVAQQIAVALKVNLTPKEKEYIEKKPTEKTEAYNYYLKGREYYYRYKKQDNETAIELFKKAISLDLNYSLAWAGLGDAYAQRPSRYGFPSRWLDSAMSVSKKAIELDNSSAEAHKALGLVYLLKRYYDSSNAANLRAIDLNPNYWAAIANIGHGYSSLGELSQSLPWYNKSILIAPMLTGPYAGLGRIYRLVGEYGKAEQYLRKASDLQFDEQDVYNGVTILYLSQGKDREANELMTTLSISNSDNSTFLEWAGYVAAMTGDLAKAKVYYQRSLALRALTEIVNDSSGGTMLGYILIKEGKQVQAEKILTKEMIIAQHDMEKGVQGGDPEYILTRIAAIRGNKKESYIYLEKAIERGQRDYQFAVRDPRFENIRNDEEFKKLIAQMKAKVDEQRKLIEQMENEERGK